MSKNDFWREVQVTGCVSAEDEVIASNQECYGRAFWRGCIGLGTEGRGRVCRWRPGGQTLAFQAICAP